MMITLDENNIIIREPMLFVIFATLDFAIGY